MEKNYYQILGLDENASFDKIKKNYRRCALEIHSDKYGEDESFKHKFEEVKEAYSFLRNKYISNKETTYSSAPEILFFNSSSNNALIKGDKTTLSWEIINSNDITLQIETSFGISQILDLGNKNSIEISPETNSTFIELSLIAKNNLAQTVKERSLLFARKADFTPEEGWAQKIILFIVCAIMIIAVCFVWFY